MSELTPAEFGLPQDANHMHSGLEQWRKPNHAAPG